MYRRNLRGRYFAVGGVVFNRLTALVALITTLACPEAISICTRLAFFAVIISSDRDFKEIFISEVSNSTLGPFEIFL